MTETTLESLLDEIAAMSPADDFAKVAVFDADHTLWAADLADHAVQKAMRERRFRPEAREPVARILEAHGIAAAREPHADSRAIIDHYKQDRIGEVGIISAQVVCFAGWTPEEAVAFGREVFEESVGPLVYEGVAALHAALRARGIDIRVISGSAQWLVEGAVGALGVPGADVLAAQTYVEGDRITGYMADPITYRWGKVAALERLVGERGAWLGFGDSRSDVPMLERCAVRVAVNARPKIRLLAAGDPRWRQWFPARTVGGHAVERVETERVVV